MTFTLYVDEERWQAHMRSVLGATPGIVPVTKGNGYGLGNTRLAQEAARLGADTLAVGTADEVPAVREHFDGDVLVLAPAYPGPAEDPSGRVVQTVAHVDALRGSGGARVVLEAMTSMRRHGLTEGLLPAVPGLLDGVRLEGLAFHLPMDRHGGYDPVAEVAAWLRRFAGVGVPTDTAWVSHLTPAELARLRADFPGTTFRPRIGTSLWLGDRGALVARGTVLDVHPVERGQRYGYRRHRARRDSHLVVVS
ncbi:MAG: alanine racemase, partial [Actinomycetes bacterium]